jgi:hypothetical protein
MQGLSVLLVALLISDFGMEECRNKDILGRL